MEYSVVEKIHINRARAKKIGAFLYDPKIDGLYLESPWPFPVQIGMTNRLSKCEVTPMFLRLPFIMKGWLNQDILLRMVDLLRLVGEGKILMHGSCVGDTLIVGLPNAGKTYQTYRMVSSGGKLISEEYTVLYDGKAHPYSDVMRTCFSARTMKDCGIDMTLWEKIWLFFATIRAKLFPFMYEAVIWKEIKASGEESKIKRIIYGSTGQEVKDWKHFAILCENEFPFMSSEFLQAYALASGLDLIAIQNKQRELIRRFVLHVYPDHRK